MTSTLLATSFLYFDFFVLTRFLNKHNIIDCFLKLHSNNAFGHHKGSFTSATLLLADLWQSLLVQINNTAEVTLGMNKLSIETKKTPRYN